jgi:phthalate 4,5-cis-dihydrodiol dehydrogenase
MRTLKVGVAGLGRAFAVMAPTFAADPRVELVAAADPRPEARKRFEADFGGRAFSSLQALLEKGNAEAIYIATPHQFHARQARLAAAAGKHLLVEKPMALTLAQCRAMIEAARAARVALVVGHSHSFDAPVLRARELIAGGELGRVRMISALDYTDFLYRPRRAEELDTAAGGGAIYNQGAHQIDIVRLLAGSPVTSVRAATGAWDPARPTEGAYAGLLGFADGSFASVVYSGYAHFDSDELCGWIGEMGQQKDPAQYGAARRALAAADESALKRARNYGGPDQPQLLPSAHQHFGLLVVSCERADLRPTPQGVMVYGDREQRLEAVPLPQAPRASVIDELYGAAVEDRPALHDGAWAMATLEVCLAMLRSARSGREIRLGRSDNGTSTIR